MQTTVVCGSFACLMPVLAHSGFYPVSLASALDQSLKPLQVPPKQGSLCSGKHPALAARHGRGGSKALCLLHIIGENLRMLG